MQNFFKVLSKRWKEILAITVLTAALSVAFGYFYNKTAYTNTIFINIGAGRATGQNAPASPYEEVQAADSFTETVQGWFKNPVLTDKIRINSGYNVNLGVRKQEKQNLVVTFKSETPEQGKKTALVTEEIIRGEIGKYNRETGGDFRMPVSDILTKEETVHLALFALIGTVLGFILGYFMSILLEKFLSELHQFRRGKPWI